eukprot:TRINITY_DN4256_c0_g1_i2.p1 TRINITY_DN4256_c0_g1~~TRINITY_DN4256_c0_g1_i2.p1  ORF type:complete len:232 (-),score=13.32 TRINITY_DN4256_c0_g1_i2:143-838(-)
MSLPEQVVDDAVEFLHQHNTHYCKATRVKKISVWGGWVANVAESRLSYLVDRSSHDLECLIYYPQRTKGGALVRPKYHQGDRGGVEEFSQLTSMTVPGHIGLPSSWGYITPNLKHLTLLFPPEESLPDRDKWRLTGPHPASLLESSPNLQEIIVGEADFPKPYEIDVWWKLYPPMIFEWEYERLLWISILKEPQSYLARLPREVIAKILSYLKRPWRQINIKQPPNPLKPL